jgi:hypothetical protein
VPLIAITILGKEEIRSAPFLRRSAFKTNRHETAHRFR